VIEKRSTCRRQFDTAGAAYQELSADFQLQIANLPAEGRLRRMQPPLGRESDTALLGDGNEIA
jgi:hypothetical protein